MRLEISPRLWPDNSEGQRTISAMIQSVIASAVSLVEVSPDKIEAVILSDEESFGPTIHRLQREAGATPSYTDNELYKAAGKTIAHHRSGTTTTSTIVFRDNFMAEILGNLQGGDDLENWGEDGQLCFYIFTHEVGHCKDNALRPESEEILLTRHGTFRIHQIAGYYGSILLSEVAACVHSAAAMTEHTHRQEISRWRDESEQILKGTTKQWRAYQRDNNLLRELAFHAAQSFWVIILQYAKLVGTRIGNPGLSAADVTWYRIDEQTAVILDEIKSAVEEVWRSYPAWTEEVADRFFPLWLRLAESHGYRFVHQPESDGVYFDRRIILGS